MYSGNDELPLAARAGTTERSTMMPEGRVHQEPRSTWRGASGTEGLDVLMRDASRHRSVAAVSRDLGHEIKSVLNVVTLNLALLSRVASTSQPSRADLELAARSSDVMRRELKRLDSYIDGILRAHARDDEGWQRLDLCATCQRIALLIASRATRQRVVVRAAVPESEVFIEACPAQLQNAILNLAINALDAMPNGGTLDLQVVGRRPRRARSHQRQRSGIVRRRALRPLATPPDGGRSGRRPGREQGGGGRARRPDRIPSGQRRPGRVFHPGVHQAHRPLKRDRHAPRTAGRRQQGYPRRTD